MQRVATNLAPVRRLRGAPAAAQVHAALRDAIAGAELEPGRRLSENELAAQLGVSRTPVREALARLRDDRLVEIVPQLGTFVARISVASVNDAQFIREALECSAVRLAVARATPDDVELLRAIIARQERVRDTGDEDAFLALDDELHATLCAIAGHAVAWSIVKRANGHLDRVRRLSVPQPHYLAEMVAEHAQVVEAVAAGDGNAAEEQLRHHLRMVLSELPAIQAAHPDYFEAPR